MIAFAIIDTRSPDFQDPEGKPIEEYFDFEGGL